MKEIYTHADRVVVWLGLDFENSKTALSIITHFGSQIVLTRDFQIGPAPGCTDTKLWQGNFDYSQFPHDTKSWQAVSDLLNSPWFDRVW
jgi:hypothetical protein